MGTRGLLCCLLEAVASLAKLGIEAEVIDPRTTFPLDRDALVESARKTGRVIVVDEGHYRYGVGAHLAAVISEGAFFYLDKPVKCLAAMDVPMPFSPALEDLALPGTAAVVSAAQELCDRAS